MPAEVGPEAVGDEDLGVGDLPEQEVRDALLARGADDEVGVGHVRGVEATRSGDVHRRAPRFHRLAAGLQVSSRAGAPPR